MAVAWTIKRNGSQEPLRKGFFNRMLDSTGINKMRSGWHVLRGDVLYMAGCSKMEREKKKSAALATPGTGAMEYDAKKFVKLAKIFGKAAFQYKKGASLFNSYDTFFSLGEAYFMQSQCEKISGGSQKTESSGMASNAFENAVPLSEK